MTAARIVTLTPNAALDLWTSTPAVLPGPKLRCTAPSEDPGGGGINVSRVAVRLGSETLAIYAAGGLTGAAVGEALRREGVAAAHVPTAGATRQSFSVQDEGTGAVYRFVTPGTALAAEEVAALLQALDRALNGAPNGVSNGGPNAAPDPGAIVVGSGSLPPGVAPGFWAECAARARAAGARFVLDTGTGAAEALAVGVTVFRENADVIARIAGSPLAWPGETADWARERIAQGAAEIVIATEGARGALMVTREAAVLLAPPRVVTTSAIGAGDSFVAGFCHAIAAGDPPEEALRLGVATAAATMLTPGTELCARADVLRLLGEVGAPVPL